MRRLRCIALALAPALLAAAAPGAAHGQGYSIPPDNPFAGRPGAAPEVYALGLRNPYRFSFDRATGALALGDVGGASREELNLLPSGAARGRNFGWPCREGRTVGPVSCAGANPVEPILDYANPPDPGTPRAITAGHVVRDPSLTGLAGRVLYADFYLGEIRSVNTDGSGDAGTGATVPTLAGFGEDALGRLYAVDLIGGRLLRLAAGPSPGALTTQQVGGSFEAPISVTAPRRDRSRLFVVERAGRVRLLLDGSPAASPFLDISPLVSTDGERGLLSIAFAPDYASSGLLYAFYTDRGGDLRVDELRRSQANPNSAQPSSRRNVIAIEHSGAANHNGGQLAFGPDGLLYAATGDGGGAIDPRTSSQNPGSRLGKILRLAPRGRSGGGGPPGGGRPSAPLDRRAPRLGRRVPRRQRVLARGGVWLYARCDERCTVTASGRLLIRGSSYPLRPARRRAVAGRRLALKLRLTRRSRRALRRALRRGARPLALVAVTARDPAGNTTRRARHVVVVRR